MKRITEKDLRDEIDRLRATVDDTCRVVEALKAENQQLDAINEQLRGDKSDADRRLKALGQEFSEFRERFDKELRFERGRLAQALDVADHASLAAGSIARLTNRVSETLQYLEVRLESENKARRAKP